MSISKEKAGTDTESKPKESAVWIYFEKMDQVGAGYRVASCKDCGKAVKILKGNTTNLMSHLRTKHPKIHEEMRQKTDEKKRIRKQSIQAKKFNDKQQTTLPDIAAS